MFFLPQSRLGLIFMTGVVMSTVLFVGLSTYRFTTSVTAVPISDVCGNGYKEGLEQCDDGNLLNGDGCNNQCLIEIPAPVCGNGVLEASEQCDDGNVVDSDGCSSLCEVVVVPPEPVCGNGVLEGFEQCDDGNLLNGDGCNDLCEIVIEPPVPVCGNGVLEGSEACDDGNILNGDGCSDQCVIVEAPPVVVDNDNDGVLNESDVCPNTKVENISLNPNQYAQNNSTLAFEVGPKNDQSVIFTMADTKGCSCEQIAKELGIGEGHIKKGCSLGNMERWTGIKVKGKAR
jgi:cysteine-rich repeat protein